MIHLEHLFRLRLTDVLKLHLRVEGRRRRISKLHASDELGSGEHHELTAVAVVEAVLKGEKLAIVQIE